MKFTLAGGGAIEANSPAELLEALQADTATWQPQDAADREGWMRAYAERTFQQTGRRIRYRSETLFLIGLAEAGLVNCELPMTVDGPAHEALDFLHEAGLWLVPAFWMVEVRWTGIVLTMSALDLLAKTAYSMQVPLDDVDDLAGILETAIRFAEGVNQVDTEARSTH